MQGRDRLYLSWDTNTQGALTRARSSLDALRTLDVIRREERPATADERTVLAGWSGWGPMTPVFDPKTDSWQNLADEVMELLTPEQVEAGKSATYSAFYTPPAIATACWSILTSLGFDGGRVLEPGCGAGVFMAQRPAGLDAPVRMVGVERDPTTAAIAALVHPDAQVIASPFEEARVAEASVDAAIGNVPFGDVSVFDPAAPDAVCGSLHGYFVWRSIRALRPGGIAVLITSRYLLDSTRTYMRQALHEEAQFLGAVRLPNAALASGGTDVVTDIVVFRKRRPGDDEGSDEWTGVERPDGLNGEGINKWVADNPKFVLGTLAPDRAPHYGRTVRVDPPVSAPKGAALAGYVAGQVEKSGEVLARTARRAGTVWDVDPEPSADTQVALTDAQGRKERSFHLVGGKVQQVRDGRLTPVTGATNKELIALVKLRDAAVTLLDAEANHRIPDGDLVAPRVLVNALYDEYVAEFGYLNRSDLIEGAPDPETGVPLLVRRRPRMGGFRADPDYVTVLALEVWDDETSTGTKAPILLGRVNRPAQRPDHADTPGEALALALDQSGRVDVDEIARLLRMPVGDAPAALGDLVYLDPQELTWVPADEYLSGNVRVKLAAARRAADRDSDTYGRNVAALEKVHPKDLEPGEIRAKLGSPWIPPRDVEDFLTELLGKRPTVTRIKVTAEWEVEIDDWSATSAAATSEWGTERQSAYELAEKALNGKAPAVYDTVKVDGSEKRVRNVPETMAAEAKQREIAARFAEWVWETPERADRLAAEYNRLFNSHVLRRFDGSHLTFPGLADWFNPYPHQRDMVHRMLNTPRALCGHTVGAGKTATMFMGAITLRRLGLANKPLIVVPNHLLEQVAREGRQLFPSAKVLMVGRDDLRDKLDRKLFAARAATGDWDAVVITHSAFTAIPVHPRTEAGYLLDLAEDFRAAIADRDGRSGRDRKTKQLEKMLDNMRAKAKERLHHRVDDGVFFEQLGVDYVLMDEAHYYKNLSVPVRTDGFSINPSKRASDLDMKLRWLSERRARCATLFTGTPVSNTMLELYVLQHYLAPDRLEELDIASPDAWAANFVKFESRVEVSPDGISFRLHHRPSKFINVPELRMLLAQFADIRNGKDLGLKRPAARFHTVVAPGSREQRSFITDLARRTDRVRGGGDNKLPDGREDNMLLICSDGRKAALDPDLVGIGGRARKVEAVVERVAKRFHSDRDRTLPGDASGVTGAMQIVFSDLGTPNEERGTQVYGKIRAGLIDAGVPANMIRFIHEAKTDSAKKGLFADCNAGRVAVLMGSTDKLGVGTNVQRRVSHMHHVDAPWRPADIEQREGRGIRPGNLHPIVEVHRYVTRGSFDSYMWQTLERKQTFISQVLTGEGNAREVEDIGDGALSAGEVKALATGNPMLLEKAAVDAEVARLRSLSTAHTRSQRRLRRDIEAWEAEAQGLQVDAKAWDAVAAKAAGHTGAAAADHQRQALDEDALVGYVGEIVKEAVDTGYTWRRVTLSGVDVMLSAEQRYGRKLLRAKFAAASGLEAAVVFDGKMARPTQHAKLVAELQEAIDGAGDEAKRLRRQADRLAERVAEAAPLEGKTFAHVDELRAVEDRLADIDAQIRQAAQEVTEKGGGEEEVDVLDDEDEPLEVHSDPMPEIPEHYRNPQPEPKPEPKSHPVKVPVPAAAPVEVASPQPALPVPVAATAAGPEPMRTVADFKRAARAESRWMCTHYLNPAVSGLRTVIGGTAELRYTFVKSGESTTGRFRIPKVAECRIDGDSLHALAGPDSDRVLFTWTRVPDGVEPSDVQPTPLPDGLLPFESRRQVVPAKVEAVKPAPEPVAEPLPGLVVPPVPTPTARPQRKVPAIVARPHKPVRGPRTAVVAGCTRVPIGRQLRHAAQVVGRTCEAVTDAAGAPVYRISGTGRDMTAAEAADYLLAGGFPAALVGAAPVVHPDRLAERGIEPVRVSGNWAQLILS